MIWRYTHGGGRVFRENASGTPTLVADFYNQGDREFYVHAHDDIPALLAEVAAWRERFADLARDKSELIAEARELRETLKDIYQQGRTMEGTALGTQRQERNIWLRMLNSAGRALQTKGDA